MLAGYLTASEAAKRAKIEYPTLLARLRRNEYKHHRVGTQIFIHESVIPEINPPTDARARKK